MGRRLLERCEHHVHLECLGQSHGPFWRCDKAAFVVVAADVVALETAWVGHKVSAAADTFQIGKVSWMAHLSDVNVALILRASLSMMMPSAV